MALGLWHKLHGVSGNYLCLGGHHYFLKKIKYDGAPVIPNFSGLVRNSISLFVNAKISRHRYPIKHWEKDRDGCHPALGLWPYRSFTRSHSAENIYVIGLLKQGKILKRVGLPHYITAK